MITRPTVFILGAGASMPYGYPSGNTLVKKILEITDISHPFFKELRRLGYRREKIESFKGSLQRSRAYSIDTFLEHNPDFIEIGKIAIAQVLILYERESLNYFNNLEKEDDWYRYLFSQLNTSFDDFDKNKISFITFNYDRSLEHYLFDALIHLYTEVTEQKCADKLKNIPIVHMYGKLDHLPWEYWQKGKKRPYARHERLADLRESSKGINIMHENFDDKDFKEAHKILDKASRVYFLGLNLLNKINLDRLKIVSDYFKKRDDNTHINWCGTAYELKKAERQRIRRYFMAPRVSASRIKLGYPDEDSLLFLREHVKL